MLITRILKQIACTAVVTLLISGCGDDSVSPPPTGSVSGKITFVGTQPDSGSVYINAAVHYPITGPTDYYEALEVALVVGGSVVIPHYRHAAHRWRQLEEEEGSREL